MYETYTAKPKMADLSVSEARDSLSGIVNCVAVRQLIEELQRANLLRSHSLEPRNRLLLVGPPGNGNAVERAVTDPDRLDAACARAVRRLEQEIT